MVEIERKKEEGRKGGIERRKGGMETSHPLIEHVQRHQMPCMMADSRP